MVVEDSAVSAKTPSPKWKGPKLGLRNPPRRPSPVLSPALALAPASILSALGKRQARGPSWRGRPEAARTRLPRLATRRSGPWIAPRVSRREPHSLSPRRENSWEARERRCWGALDVAPYLRDAPSSHPLAPAEQPPLTQRRGDTDCAGKAALLQRAAAEAAGGAGGGRGAGLRGRRPAALARCPSPGAGVPVPPSALEP